MGRLPHDDGRSKGAGGVPGSLFAAVSMAVLRIIVMLDLAPEHTEFHALPRFVSLHTV